MLYPGCYCAKCKRLFAAVSPRWFRGQQSRMQTDKQRASIARRGKPLLVVAIFSGFRFSLDALQRLRCKQQLQQSSKPLQLMTTAGALCTVPRHQYLRGNEASARKTLLAGANNSPHRGDSQRFPEKKLRLQQTGSASSSWCNRCTWCRFPCYLRCGKKRDY
ncbi:hypothetical protein CCHOA_03770 [Corynebacterium choanae]|uniref:Uncharacterized protein n=1 Tax=Corynebacterium choanae TaxID=1862358 RepID=A0A3G6J5X1_9CORY|nr:hypothetical protein CCHOA_03770 [Corynebacterium choanae]